jgi:uncharacterized membrane protein YgdD (TMEM256/DUF423 family)
LEPKFWLTAGCLLAGFAVAAGAFGAHGLEARLKPAADASQSDRELSERRLQTFETAVRYHMYHALGLIAVGFIGLATRSVWTDVAGWMFVAGVVIFSGMLYGWVLTQYRPLAMIVPIGGTAFITGWVALAVAAWTATHQPQPTSPAPAEGGTANRAANR